MDLWHGAIVSHLVTKNQRTKHGKRHKSWPFEHCEASCSDLQGESQLMPWRWRPQHPRLWVFSCQHDSPVPQLSDKKWFQFGLWISLNIHGIKRILPFKSEIKQPRINWGPILPGHWLDITSLYLVVCVISTSDRVGKVWLFAYIQTLPQGCQTVLVSAQSQWPVFPLKAVFQSLLNWAKAQEALSASGRKYPSLKKQIQEHKFCSEQTYEKHVSVHQCISLPDVQPRWWMIAWEGSIMINHIPTIQCSGLWDQSKQPTYKTHHGGKHPAARLWELKLNARRMNSNVKNLEHVESGWVCDEFDVSCIPLSCRRRWGKTESTGQVPILEDAMLQHCPQKAEP